VPERTIRRVAVIGGGANDEHDVSLASAAAVVRAVRALDLTAVPLTIDRRGGWRVDDAPVPPAEAIHLLASCDIAFPVLHGVDGEDGAVAGLLRLTRVPFVGSPVRAGALGMDKWVTKLVAEELGIRTAPGMLVDGRVDAADLSLEPPFVVKPWPAFGAKPTPWTPGVFGMSPSTLPVAPSTTMTWVARDTKTRPVALSTDT